MRHSARSTAQLERGSTQYPSQAMPENDGTEHKSVKQRELISVHDNDGVR